jgi:hypothetical protein
VIVALCVLLVFPTMLRALFINDYVKLLLHFLMPFNIEFDYRCARSQLYVILRIIEDPHLRLQLTTVPGALSISIRNLLLKSAALQTIQTYRADYT